ncbi:MAG: rubrerythrin family protein [Verrucomicrobiae bacterium]|nr:rubrerythrin family protein [Verrucomicrobiae bacterium]
MPTTTENLNLAFAGESKANRKYVAFAKKAEKDGLPQIARLFRAVAEAETIHALGHLESMDGIRGTLENLQEAIAAETYEFKEMYPPMLEQAQKDNHRAKKMFGYAVKAEETHAELFAQALAAAKAGRDLDPTQIWLCPICGHVELGKPPAKCPICGVPADKYVEVK